MDQLLLIERTLNKSPKQNTENVMLMDNEASKNGEDIDSIIGKNQFLHNRDNTIEQQTRRKQKSA